MTRRAPLAATLALVVAAALLWGSSRLTWVRATASDDLRGTRSAALAGGTWAGATVPLALVLLAAVAAVLAVRGWARRVVAALVLLVAVGAAVPAVGLLASGAGSDQAAELLDPPALAPTVTASTAAAGPVLALAGALVAVLAAVVLVRTRPAGGGLSSRYTTPATRRAAARAEVVPDRSESPDPAAAALTERVLWDALDAGEDPTLGAPAGPAGGRGGGRDEGHPQSSVADDQSSAERRGESGGPG